jgi:hypothetical protein
MLKTLRLRMWGIIAIVSRLSQKARMKQVFDHGVTH